LSSFPERLSHLVRRVALYLLDNLEGLVIRLRPHEKVNVVGHNFESQEFYSEDEALRLDDAAEHPFHTSSQDFPSVFGYPDDVIVDVVLRMRACPHGCYLHADVVCCGIEVRVFVLGHGDHLRFQRWLLAVSEEAR